MLISQRYRSSAAALGSPQQIRAAREFWVVGARKERSRARWGAVAMAVGLTFFFAFLGMVPWMLRRVAAPEQLAQQLSSNMPHGNAHLGAEYYNIAAAIVDGRGFSDPFVVPSGPTAWMPPLLVWIQAGLIASFDGDRYWVMVSVVLLKTLLLALCGALIVREGWRTQHGWVAFGILSLFLFADFHACFGFTHDGWLILAGVTSTMFGLAYIDRCAATGCLTWWHAVAWGGLGGMIALSSPVAGFTWALGTTICLLRRAPVGLLLAAAMSMLVVTPWAIRNYRVFGQFVPVKSNVFFEFDQSLALDRDGLLDWKTMSKHPYHAGPEQDKYVRMGEIAYLETKKERFLRQWKNKPEEYYRKMKNRLIGTTLWPAGFSSFRVGSPTLPFRWLLYPLPALAAMFLVVFGRPLSRLQFWAIVVYVAYLIPYIACSYYPRYGFPLLVVKILLCVWAVQLIIRWNRHSQLRLA